MVNVVCMPGFVVTGVYHLGAFNLSIAYMASQQSKAAKEQLQVARVELKDLLEDLCDIVGEFDAKLGIFRVHINGNCYYK